MTEAFDAVWNFLFHNPEWIPDSKGESFGASSFLTFSVAFNIALVKWEPFSRGLRDLKSKLEKQKDEETKRQKQSSVFADEAYAPDLAVIDRRCAKKVENLQQLTTYIWNGARLGAVVASVLGGLSLFFHCSVGFLGMLLWIAPLTTFGTEIFATLRIRRIVNNHFKEEIERLGTLQEIEEEKRVAKVESKIGSVE